MSQDATTSVLAAAAKASGASAITDTLNRQIGMMTSPATAAYVSPGELTKRLEPIFAAAVRPAEPRPSPTP